MGRAAFLLHDAGHWNLSVAGEETDFDDYQEALGVGRRTVADLGGGTIYVGPGPGVARTAVRVEAGARAAPPSPLSALAMSPPPIAPQAPSPPPPPQPSAEGADGAANISAEIAALCTAYQQAQVQIDAFEDDVERDIGLGTLRLEANHTLQQLRATGPGLTEADLQPLSACVGSLSGGKTTELAVQSFEKASNKILRDVFSSLFYLTLKGSVALIVGAFVYYYGQSAELGAKFAGVLAAGGGSVVYGAFRALGQAAPAAGQVVENTWDWAGRVGDATDRAMAEPRRIELRLWQRCAGDAPWRHRSLARRARFAAQAVVGTSLLAIGIGALGFLGGFLGFFE